MCIVVSGLIIDSVEFEKKKKNSFYITLLNTQNAFEKKTSNTNFVRRPSLYTHDSQESEGNQKTNDERTAKRTYFMADSLQSDTSLESDMSLANVYVGIK